MNLRIRISLYLCCLAFSLNLRPLNVSAQTPAAKEQLRDGQHDFDFRFGIWHLHFRFLSEPLSGSSTWAESDGIVTVRQIWNGRASLEELKAGTPSAPFEGMTILLYNPQARHNSLNMPLLPL